MTDGLNLTGMNKKPTATQPGQMGLFNGSPLPATAPPQLPALAVPSADTLALADLSAEILHAYPRYGLAVATHLSRLAETVTEAALRTALVRAIESGLGQFRMRTWSNSLHDRVLRFEAVRLADLQQQPNLNKGSLAQKGVYLFPTVITIDGKDTPSLLFKASIEIIQSLGKGQALNSQIELMRSFAPTTGKLNHNAKASPTPPKGTLLEAACALITTITWLKPAAWVRPRGAKEQDGTPLNTAIIPDLPLPQLREFIAVFEGMLGQETDDLMNTWERALPPATETKATGKTATKAAGPEFRRPRLHSGNYPDAPRDAGAFGPVGLLGAIGRWARRTRQQGRGRAVLDTLAGRPLLVISYDQISQVRFDHHTTRLALDHDLTGIVDALYLGTRFYSEADNPGTPFGKPEFKTFCLMAGRFLQTFTAAAFIDFLAFRAEYAAETEPLFTEYFRTMIPKIPADVVESAGELGRWLNRTAYFAAKAEAEDFPSKKRGKDQQIKEAKAKILVVLESAALSAKSPEAMISQVLTQAGRMSLDEAPGEARRFVDAANTREIDHDQAKHLLISYMRLRSTGKSRATADEAADAGSATPEPQATENYDHLADN